MYKSIIKINPLRGLLHSSITPFASFFSPVIPRKFHLSVKLQFSTTSTRNNSLYYFQPVTNKLLINVSSLLIKRAAAATTTIKCRHISSLDTPHDIERAERWLKKFTKDMIPKEGLTIAYCRSSGPGGQNVNKLNTKVDLRFNIEQAYWIPEYARKKLVVQESNHINKTGEWIVTSDRSRSQKHNLDDCIAKLYDAIVKAAAVPKAPSQETVERIERLKKAEDRRRKEEKQIRSQKKSSRRIRFDD
ncbi:4382_t:CDS:2 [Ambispora gerdemannii]|uniref:4382_t:CDS:1 n=1 Tax=Ambispora gerdemannii TaxID=144530 RepID=A0A9N9AY99_9GLOM|nr:4382_t:CDS:2 [Ambispora gerdemannii]